MSDYRLLIARRYLSGKRSLPLISRITGISMVGVALGVAALIVVLSVLNGFFDFVRDMLISYDPHVRIEHVEANGITNADSLVALAAAHPGVTQAVPYIEGKALLLHDGSGDVNKVVVVRGLDPALLQADEGVVVGTTFGSFDLEREGGSAGIVLGRRLGERLLLAPGGPGQEASRVALVSAPAIERMFTRVLSGTPLRQFEVRGLFQLESVFDESHAFVHIDEARRLFRVPNAVSGIDVRLSDLDDASAVKAWLEERLPAGEYRVQTWYDLQRSLYEVMELEKYGATLLLMLIVLVAAFNIVGALTMIVIEKRRDVGVLRAMGVTKANIRRIFLAEGLYIGLIGSGAGLVLGVALAWAQHQFKIVPLADAGSFLIDAYPVAIRPFDVLAIGLMALVLCILAAWYPAVRASKINPAEAVAVDG